MGWGMHPWLWIAALGFPEPSLEPNCEGIFLKLESGRVTSKVYSAD